MAQSNQSKLNGIQTSTEQQLNDDIDRSCPICMEEFNNEHCRQAFTSCGHSFCQNCLQRTLKIQPFCPICRQHQQQQQDNFNNQKSEKRRLDPNIPWNPEVVRAYFSKERLDENGSRMRTVRLSDGETTGIHVGRGVKINISPGSNLVINGKRVQNPSDCNQQ